MENMDYSQTLQLLQNAHAAIKRPLKLHEKLLHLRMAQQLEEHAKRLETELMLEELCSIWEALKTF